MSGRPEWVYGDSVIALRMWCGQFQVSRRETELLSAGCRRAGGVSPTEPLSSNATGVVGSSSGRSELIRSDPSCSSVIQCIQFTETGYVGDPDLFGCIRTVS